MHWPSLLKTERLQCTVPMFQTGIVTVVKNTKTTQLTSDLILDTLRIPGFNNAKQMHRLIFHGETYGLNHMDMLLSRVPKNDNNRIT